MNTFSGEKLSILMELAGENNSSLGRKVGVSDVTIFRWRTGKARPSRKNATKLAEILNVSVRDFSTGVLEVPREFMRDVKVVRLLEEKDEEVNYTMPVPSNWDIDLGVIANADMMGEINQDELVFVSNSKELEPGKIYLLEVGGKKYLRKCIKTNSGYIFVSTNQAKPAIENNYTIIGKVTYAMKSLS